MLIIIIKVSHSCITAWVALLPEWNRTV